MIIRLKLYINKRIEYYNIHTCKKCILYVDNVIENFIKKIEYKVNI